MKKAPVATVAPIVLHPQVTALPCHGDREQSPRWVDNPTRESLPIGPRNIAGVPFSLMEKSQKYPQLSRYCYAWEWLVQFRVHKPNKQKKEWIDWTEVLGTDADDALKALGFLCERKGWTLLETYLLKPTALAFAFDRDAPEHEFLTKEQKQQLIPRPELRGSEYRPLTQAQRQEQKQQAQLARQQQRRQQQQQRKDERHRLKITTAFPLLAAELLAAEFPQVA
jgi:hypothetical protein